MRFSTLVLTGVLIATVGTVSATAVDCAQDQASMNLCVKQHFEASDLSLNETYRALMERVSREAKGQLLRAQHARQVSRDAQCAGLTRQAVAKAVQAS